MFEGKWGVWRREACLFSLFIYLFIRLFGINQTLGIITRKIMLYKKIQKIYV